MALPTQYIVKTPPDRVSAYQTPLIPVEDYSQLNKLTSDAVFDSQIEHRLVTLRDDALPTIYHISARTWGYVKNIEADSLQEFCQQVLELQNIMVDH